MIGPQGENLAFLLGLPRSGTTLLSVMLGKHPDVCCPPEPWLMLAIEALGKVSHRHPADSQVLGGALAEFLGDKGAQHVARIAAMEAYNRKLAEAGLSWFVDKTPRYYLILPYLQQLFPAAKFVWLQRNPLAVAASYKSTWGMDLPQLLSMGIDNWAYYDLIVGPRRLMEFSRQTGGTPYWVKYEDLVESPEPTIQSLTAWMGLPPAENLSEFDASGAVARAYTGDKKIVGTHRPHKDSLNAWESAFSNDDLQTLLDAIGADVFRDSGYAGVLERLAERGVCDRGPDVTAAYVAKAESALRQRWVDIHSAASASDTVARTPRFPGARLDTLDSMSGPAAEQALELETIRQQQAALNEAYHKLQEDHRVETESLQQQLGDARQEDQKLREAYGKLLADHDTWQKQAKHLEQVILGLNEPTFKKLINRTLMLVEAWVVGRPAPVEKRRKPLPRISVVTPCFNSIGTIAETIESVRAQNYPDLEYIVVDGGSTDGTLELLHKYVEGNVIQKVISEPDQGMYDAIRKGFAVATGQIFCYLNADDLFEPGGLMRVGQYFHTHPRVHLIYHEDTVEYNGWKFPNSRQVHCDTIDLMKGYMLFQDGVFFRRGLYDVIGGASSDLRFAGDYDLWLRMSRTAKLVRRPEHNSCFRVRYGQLSGDMEKYTAEQALVRDRFWKSLPPIAIKRLKAVRLLTTVKNLFHLRKWRRLFFPMDLANLPPPPIPGPKLVAGEPKCPLTGLPPDRFLLSTPDTRFGEQTMTYVYYCSKSGVAMAYPPMSEQELTKLYEKHYSDHDAKVMEPPINTYSPYKKWFGGHRFDKFLRRNLLRKKWRERVSWTDPTVDELLGLVKRRFPTHGRKLRFLDVGCFEGELLDLLRTKTDWQTCGLDPNSKAVAVAQGKGHQVWQATAEDAPYMVLDDARFDLIYLGQTIEHLNNPIKVLGRLKMLLAPGGAIVLSTPNLDSKQIDLFGPTWAHWHMPYHRVLYSPRSMKLLAGKVEMTLDKCVTHSNPYWSVMSLWLNQLGLCGAVPHGKNPPPVLCSEAVDLSIYSRFLYNWRGRGDYLYAMLSPKEEQ